MDSITKALIIILILTILTIMFNVFFLKKRDNKKNKETAQTHIKQESLFDKLIKLAKQRDEGILTEEEYEETKNKYLGIA